MPRRSRAPFDSSIRVGKTPIGTALRDNGLVAAKASDLARACSTAIADNLHVTLAVDRILKVFWAHSGKDGGAFDKLRYRVTQRAERIRAKEQAERDKANSLVVRAVKPAKGQDRRLLARTGMAKYLERLIRMRPEAGIALDALGGFLISEIGPGPVAMELQGERHLFVKPSMLTNICRHVQRALEDTGYQGAKVLGVSIKTFADYDASGSVTTAECMLRPETDTVVVVAQAPDGDPQLDGETLDTVLNAVRMSTMSASKYCRAYRDSTRLTGRIVDPRAYDILQASSAWRREDVTTTTATIITDTDDDTPTGDSEDGDTTQA